VLIWGADKMVWVQNINFTFSIHFGNEQSASWQHILLKPHSTASISQMKYQWQQ